ncbi:hypothetical protein [Leucobacter chromiireducens]|uniref:hypothetical protein n=1 Tax=Leucobacter chromiireducens TaxID=283877 RepID=UPI003F7FD143
MPAFLRLRPDLPVCWESPDTLRVGFERAYARIVSPSAGQQRLLGALRTGFAAADLPQVARRTGVTLQEARALLSAVERACLPRTEPVHALPTVPRSALPPQLFIDDAGRPVPGFAGALTHGVGSTVAWSTKAPGAGEGEVHVADGGTGADTAPALVVFVERFLEPLERAQRWLVAGIPHLLVRLTDTRASVGPIVAPPGAPCHTCITLAVLEADPGASVLAAQLVESTPASETAAVGVLAAALTVQFIDAWFRGESRVHGTRVSFEVEAGHPRGTLEEHELSAHPECGCGGFR